MTILEACEYARACHTAVMCGSDRPEHEALAALWCWLKMNAPDLMDLHKSWLEGKKTS